MRATSKGVALSFLIVIRHVIGKRIGETAISCFSYRQWLRLTAAPRCQTRTSILTEVIGNRTWCLTHGNDAVPSGIAS